MAAPSTAVADSEKHRKLTCLLCIFMKETSKVTPFTVVSWKKACECAERWKDLEDCPEKQISVEHADMWAQSLPTLVDVMKVSYGYHRSCYSWFTNKTRITRAAKRYKQVQQPMGIVPERLVDGDASMVALSSGQTVAWPLDGSVGADIDMGADLKLMEYLLAGGAIGTMASGRPHQRSSIRQEQQHAQHQLQLRRREIQQLLQDQEDDPDDEGSISKHLRMLAFKNPGRFMEDFDPERSSREMRKMNRRIYSEPRKNQMYDEAGRMLLDGRDICDCLDEDCVGCHFPCTKCSSRKCGMECRSNRRWIYMEVEIEGTNQKLYFPEVPLTYN